SYEVFHFIYGFVSVRLLNECSQEPCWSWISWGIAASVTTSILPRRVSPKCGVIHAVCHGHCQPWIEPLSPFKFFSFKEASPLPDRLRVSLSFAGYQIEHRKKASELGETEPQDSGLNTGKYAR